MVAARVRPVCRGDVHDARRQVAALVAERRGPPRDRGVPRGLHLLRDLQHQRDVGVLRVPVHGRRDLHHRRRAPPLCAQPVRRLRRRPRPRGPQGLLRRGGVVAVPARAQVLAALFLGHPDGLLDPPVGLRDLRRAVHDRVPDPPLWRPDLVLDEQHPGPQQLALGGDRGRIPLHVHLLGARPQRPRLQRRQLAALPQAAQARAPVRARGARRRRGHRPEPRPPQGPRADLPPDPQLAAQAGHAPAGDDLPDHGHAQDRRRVDARRRALLRPEPRSFLPPAAPVPRLARRHDRVPRHDLGRQGRSDRLRHDHLWDRRPLGHTRALRAPVAPQAEHRAAVLRRAHRPQRCDHLRRLPRARHAQTARAGVHGPVGHGVGWPVAAVAQARPRALCHPPHLRS